MDGRSVQEYDGPTSDVNSVHSCDDKMSQSLEKPPLAANESEGRILAALASMAHGTEYSSVPTTDGRFLRQMTEAVGAKRVVELGTSNGYSGIWFALRSRRRADTCGPMKRIRRGQT